MEERKYLDLNGLRIFKEKLDKEIAEKSCDRISETEIDALFGKSSD